MTGNRPSGSLPESVKASVWQTPVATILTSTSPALGPSTWISSIESGLPAPQATAALDFISPSVFSCCHRGQSAHASWCWSWCNTRIASTTDCSLCAIFGYPICSSRLHISLRIFLLPSGAVGSRVLVLELVQHPHCFHYGLQPVCHLWLCYKNILYQSVIAITETKSGIWLGGQSRARHNPVTLVTQADAAGP